MFKAVVFDLFDTLVNFRADLFPVVMINGRPERTTSKSAYDALAGAGYSLPDYGDFHRHWIETSKEVWGERDRDPELREVTSEVRFGKFVERLEGIPQNRRAGAARIAMETHMERLIGSTAFDAARLDLLRKIKEAGLGVGLLSNFDNAAAARRLLERTGLAPLLDAALISEEEGYRKPAGRLYLRAAELLGAPPAEVLFVGDNYEADVAGPRGVGMPGAWLNPKGGPPPDGAPPPDFDIRKLDEVLEILGV